MYKKLSNLIVVDYLMSAQNVKIISSFLIVLKNLGDLTYIWKNSKIYNLLHTKAKINLDIAKKMIFYILAILIYDSYLLVDNQYN